MKVVYVSLPTYLCHKPQGSTVCSSLAMLQRPLGGFPHILDTLKEKEVPARQKAVCETSVQCSRYLEFALYSKACALSLGLQRYMQTQLQIMPGASGACLYFM